MHLLRYVHALHGFLLEHTASVRVDIHYLSRAKLPACIMNPESLWIHSDDFPRISSDS